MKDYARDFRRPDGVRRCPGPRHFELHPWDYCDKKFLCAATKLSQSPESTAKVWFMSDLDKNSKPEPDRKYDAKSRPCLRCRTEFLSSWPGERICRSCKSSSAWREGVAA